MLGHGESAAKRRLAAREPENLLPVPMGSGNFRNTSLWSLHHVENQ
jgi:hypothetical protein